MKSSVLALFVLCQCLAVVYGHSWLDCVNVTNPNTVTNLANMQCNYYPRAYVGRSNPDANMWKVEGMSQAQFNSYPACRNADAVYNGNFPRGRAMYPGESMTIAYTPNGHTTWMKPPPPRGPQNMYVKWTGVAGTTLRTMADVVAAPSILTVQFDQPCHSRTTGAQLDPSSGICQADVRIPLGTPPGNYQLVWYWPFRFASASVIEDYTTCWDVTVLPAAGSVTTGTPPPAGSTSTSTTGTATPTSGTGTGGTGTNTPVTTTSDVVIIARAPATIAANSRFDVTVAYVASVPRDIVVDVLDNQYRWYGKGIVNVPAGKGTVIVSVNGQNNAPMGTGYTFKAWNVERGVAGTDGDWTKAIDQDFRTLTVGAATRYADCA